MAAYSYFIEPNKLEIANYKIQDKELKGIKIVFASDFHIKSNQKERLEQIINIINLQKADIVLLAGDYVSGHTKISTMEPQKIAEGLSKIKTKYGIYATLGNHDGWYDKEYITEVLEKENIRVLDNENVKLQIEGKEVYISGVEDMMTGSPDIYKALNNIKSPIILLTHNPDIFPKIPNGVNLTLAGHTHGGQVRLPLLGALIVPSKYGDKYSQGLIKENNKIMVVTKGLGVSVLPIRFNCLPEIVVLEFVD
ncbi:metallophosphoesterase [bacterium]|nr:metallophosphoesterase [bacterium]